MTKLRPPLSVDQALSRIAGQLPGGWADMAKISTRTERHVRKWGDPDSPDQLPVDVAIDFDMAYQEAGGEGAPIFETYALRLEVARADKFQCQAELARRTIIAIKESGEAHAALVAATRDDATPQCRQYSRREVEEAIAALTATLPLLDDGAGPIVGAGSGMPLGGDP